ncbi:SDR family NAD(P)-dependent oxidoreductase [Pseudonocardia pini]|uniref:SDR family NAD(P)-dependent oxidoreductase n=1 Tax=Pseudonocardia pini TaxID=2758030 RepID=UPI0015F10CB0|nr:SDR family NAD(P)-dependent oxidoreductase [Pseudonocardia pini]
MTIPPAELRFDGRTALVTGAGAGLGRAHALELARRGARVAVNDIARTPDGGSVAERLADEIRAMGGDALALHGDVGVEAEATGLVWDTVAAFGGLDVVVNNAGHGRPSTAQDTSTELLREILEVHVFGMFWTQRAALHHMRDRGYGRIVNTGSAAGAFGAPGTFAYTTAKGAIHAMTRAASHDNRDRDIRVNAVAPVANSGLSATYFATQPQLDTTRLAPSFCSPVVAYLGHRSCELHGQLIAVGGGRAARILTAATPGLADPRLDAESLAAHLDTVLSPEGMRVLDASVEQYDLLPDFGTRPQESPYDRPRSR